MPNFAKKRISKLSKSRLLYFPSSTAPFPNIDALLGNKLPRGLPSYIFLIHSSMPLRKFRIPVVSAAKIDWTDPPTPRGASDESHWAPERWSVWHSGLLLVTSAALGGIAVAIWNRRTLAQMRQQGDAHTTSPPEE